MENKYPDYVYPKLKEEHKNLERSFQRLWGLMSPTKERDEIMWHIMSAKILINKLVEKEGETNEFK